MSSLPQPSADALAQSARLLERIEAEIDAAGGWISFARYMELALYAPGLGYYSGGARKFGPGGDFITAPELTPLFGHALAAQLEQVMHASAPELIEVGAGTGLLAADLLLELERRGCVPERYASSSCRVSCANASSTRSPRVRRTWPGGCAGWMRCPSASRARWWRTRCST